MTLYVARDTDTLAASATETVVMVKASSSKPLRVKEIGVSFNDTDASHAPIRVDLVRFSDDGTSSSLTIVEQEEVRESALATALKDFTAEPTATDILRSWYVSPAGGLLDVQFPLGDEPVVGVSGRLGLRCVTGASTTPSVAAFIVFDE